MEVKASQQYARISPKKARDIARVIQGRPAQEAIDLLEFIPRKGAKLYQEVLKSAVANAENNFNLNSDNLVVRSAVADPGPAFRRFRAGARGSAKPIRKPTSHLKVILAEKVHAHDHDHDHDHDHAHAH
ncbi:MAG: large subunit ribosomal protein L22 [Puniceicoccaceae bacterium 5H]|nr:MAG: large subunit ribosomal protein L22 [Puniceicoccaceae bacterium 5H]